MSRLFRGGIICFSLLSLGAFLLSFSAVRSLSLLGAGERPPLTFHFSLYLPDNRNSFFTGIIRGAEKAGTELGAAISIHSIDPVKNELEMASYTGVDGVIVCPYLDDALARRQLDKLAARRIPVVTINHTVPHDKPLPYIGNNNFDVGRRLGAFLARETEGPIRLAMVYSDKSPGFYGERELVEMGIAAALGSRLESPIQGFRTSLNLLDAEALLYRLLRTNPAAPQEHPVDISGEMNTIVLTDANDTLAAAQTLIDMNLVGQMRIIGFGDDPGITEYIRKGVISCTVVINPERIGYEALKSLAALRTTGYTSASIDTGVEIISPENLP